MLQWGTKKSAEVFDYRWNVTLDPGDTLVSGTISVISGDVSINSQVQDATGITVWLSGGSVGATVFRALGMTAGNRDVEDFITLDVVADDAPPLGNAIPGVASGDYATWAAVYPALAANVSQPVYQVYFGKAGLWLDNTPWSIVSDTPTRTMLLDTLVSHYAFLAGAANGGVASGIVGRISSASEGSVSISATLDGADQIPAFLAQSPYGVEFWGLTAPYRTAFYIAPPMQIADPYAFLGQGFGGGWPWGQ